MVHKRDWGQTVKDILAKLDECGECAPAEMASLLGLDRMNVSTIMTRLRRAGKKTPKRIYIVRYVHDGEGARRYPRPVYAIGDLPDAKKPKADVKANKRRYRQGLRLRMTANSVFNLGMTQRQMREIRRGNIEAA